MCLAVIHLEHSYRELTASNLEQSKRRILPALIVVPASLASQWMQEISLHFPRGLLSAQLCTSIEHIDLIRSNHSTKVWITTYDFLRRNSLAFQSLAFEMVIVDEAHTIRNPATATAQAVHSLRAKSRLALTGTPIQNNVEDVWSVMQFLLPDYLGE